MAKNKNPAPRANAGSRADFKAQRNLNTTSPRKVKAGGAGPNRVRKPQDGLRAGGRRDFAEVNRAALAALPTVLARILPGGKRVGGEFVALNPKRNDRSLGSFRVNLRSGKWADFACDARGGDIVSLCAYLQGCSQSEAARLLARMLGIEAGEPRHG
jgi:hypothetical protein